MTQKNKYLDYEGVSHLWDKMKEYIDEYILMPKYARQLANITNKGLYRLINSINAVTPITIKDGKVYLDTSDSADMGYMFSNCSRLTSLDLSNFDTSKATNMCYMFYKCGSLTSLDLSNFDTSKVTNMSYMFSSCRELTSLDLSNFDTSEVTDMSYMFDMCGSLTSLDLSNFDTSKLLGSSANYMFNNCTSLTSLKFPGMGKALILSTNPKTPHIDLSYSPLNHDSLMSIFDYNRVENSITTTLSVKLSSTSKALLTEEEKAAITAKGYTIA